ncbi:MAG: BatA domain-containing protein [Planctomycetota bacterium]
MSLLNAAMAAAGLTFVVPLAIHLLFRSRFRSMPWGAMFLLRDVVRANRRRMQWHQWILLMLRCAIPILLAFAMARPLLSSIRSAAGDAPVSLVLAMDDSRSMSALQRRTRMLSATTALLESLSPNDEVLLVRASAPHSPASSLSPSMAKQRLAAMSLDSGPTGLRSLMTRAVDACSNANFPHRKIVMVSDFQMGLNDGQMDSGQDSLSSIAQRLQAIEPAVGIDWLNVAAEESDQRVDNVLIESIEQLEPAVLLDRPSRFEVTVRNVSDRPSGSLVGQWFVNGAVVSSEDFQLEPLGVQTRTLEFTSNRAGDLSVTFVMEHADALPADNRRSVVSHVLPGVEVWLIDGEPSPEPLGGEVDFLEIALSPFDSDRTNAFKGPRNMMRTTKMRPSTLAKRLESTQRPDVLVLANVDQPASIGIDSKTDPLRTWIDDGMAVVFFDGNRVDGDAWNQCEWLPSPIGELQTSPTGTEIESPGRRFAGWQMLAGEGTSLFATVDLKHAREFTPPSTSDEDGSSPSTQVWLQTTNGTPLVMASSRVVQFAFACDDEGSTLPLRPLFPPLMQQLILHLAGSVTPSTLLPGETIQLDMDPDHVWNAGEQWTVTDPSGQRRNVAKTLGDSTIQFADTFTSGIYQFAIKDHRRRRAVEAPASESNLARIPTPSIIKMAETMEARLVTSNDELTAAMAADRYGREIWRPLMLALLVIVLMELFWQQRVSGDRATTATARPSVSASKDAVMGSMS